MVIRGPGVALGLVNPFARAARTVLRGASRGFAALLVERATRLRRGVGDAASPRASESGAPKTVFSLISNFCDFCDF